ncbi:alpha/beta hydrolase [Wukongibacter baidiensis]|uniref:alpha/beta fold hydrolase n=1 Tax=Wukongibacter baidiensis TaxID=1723361 RepID=UPI003D7F7B17
MKKNLVILSGWAVDKFVWKSIIDLLESDFQIFIIDWDDILSLDGFKEKVIDFLDKKEINKFSIMAWSLGSLVAFDLILRYSLQIENLILFGPTCKFVRNEESHYNIGWHEKIVKRMISMLEIYPQKTLDSFYKQLFTELEVNNRYYDKYIKEVKKLDKDYSVKSLAIGLEYLINKDFRESLINIDIKALIIHGEGDIICPLQSGEYLYRNLKESELIELKGTGHMPFYTKPDECYDIITDYTN